MKASQFTFATLKETPSDADVASAKLIFCVQDLSASRHQGCIVGCQWV